MCPWRYHRRYDELKTSPPSPKERAEHRLKNGLNTGARNKLTGRAENKCAKTALEALKVKARLMPLKPRGYPKRRTLSIK
jgi:hypothetical protein